MDADSVILLSVKSWMAGGRELKAEEDHSATIAQQLQHKRGEVWWYRQGAYIATAIVAAAVWFVMIGPKQVTPKTEMVDPATDALASGVGQIKDVATVSKELQFKVAAPDLKQLGGKLIKVGKTEFGGQQAAVFQYQYGKSVLLLYRFANPSNQFKDMKRVQTGKNLLYYSSGGAVSVVSWKDRRSGYYALAAKATEKDLLALAGKMVTSF